MLRATAIVMGFVLVHTIFPAASFSTAPAVTFSNGKAVITFAVAGPSDVEVAVLDGSGRIVRHLAAGFLEGANPPSSPLVQGLSQSLTWDGLDDGGQPPAGAPFTFRVRLGLKLEFERSISTKVFPNVSDYYKYEYGPGGVTYSGDILNNTHPILERMYMHVPQKLDFAVSDPAEEIFLKVYRYGHTEEARIDGRSGQLLGYISNLNFAVDNRQFWGEPVISWDGNHLYHSGGFDYIHRFTVTGDPSPWPGTGTYYVNGFPQGNQHSRGHGTGPDGSVYVTHWVKHAEDKHGRVSRIGPQGVVDGKDLVQLDCEIGGVKVDPQGNLFVGARVKPKGQLWPPAVTPFLGAAKAAQSQAPPASFVVYPTRWWAEEVYGSILKFGPQGGNVLQDGAGDLWIWGNVGTTRLTAKATGLQGMYFGLSHIQTHTVPPYGNGCICNSTRFDVDRYGRVFLPDGFRLSVVVIDNNMNEIRRLSAREVPEVAIGYPHQIEVTDRAVYVGDQLNNQIAVFRISGKSEAVLSVPAGAEAGWPWSRPAALVVAPNPLTGNARLSIGLSRPSGKVQIVSASGRVMASFPASERIVWSGAAALAPGLYAVRWRSAEGVLSTRKLVIVH